MENSKLNSSTDDFKFTLNKMSNSGALFDLNKLNDISKDVLVKTPVEEIYSFLLDWAKKYKIEIVNNLIQDKDSVLKLLSVGRDSAKPRKDLIYCEQIFEFISYFFDEYFEIVDPYPQNINEEEAKKLRSKHI